MKFKEYLIFHSDQGLSVDANSRKLTTNFLGRQTYIAGHYLSHFLMWCSVKVNQIVINVKQFLEGTLIVHSYLHLLQLKPIGLNKPRPVKICLGLRSYR